MELNILCIRKFKHLVLSDNQFKLNCTEFWDLINEIQYNVYTISSDSNHIDYLILE